MNKKPLLKEGITPALLLFFAFNLTSGFLFAQGRQVLELSHGWKFYKGQEQFAYKVDFNDAGWETVQLPHDWAIKGPFDIDNDRQFFATVQNGDSVKWDQTGRTGALPFTGVGWYRNKFKLNDYRKGQKVILLFEGAMSEPRIYLNGNKIGEWNYGYNYFYIDISDELLENKTNTLAVQLTNHHIASRWYPGAGLYRKVSIIIKEQQSIDQWGIFITTPYITSDLAKVNIKTNVSGKDIRLITHILDSNGNKLTSDETQLSYGNEYEQNLPVMNPQLWSPESPYLYTAVSQVYKGELLMDEVHTHFGIREIKYEANKGFSLNGEVRKFKGVCLHHDLGPLGAAENVAALRRQLTILKEMGCDAIRSSHNMPSLEQLKLCDEMGFMFMAESFDEWAIPKVDSGYNLYFETDAEKDIVNLVHATRNHPCIVMWSAGNEIPDQHGTDGVKRAKLLQDIFHREDPTRPVTIGMDQVKATMESGFGALLDIPGLNYRVHLYEEAFEKFPQGFILGSETASTMSSRGIYKFPVFQTQHIHYEDNQCSSYDLGSGSWSNLPDIDFVMQDDKPWVIGEFVWTGFDYLGEPTPYGWPSRSSYFGICDLGGIPKDRYYLYRSRWREDDKTLHILPHWNWEGREGETTPVFVYTSYNSAELFVNGKSMGVQKKNMQSPQNRYRLMWMDVKYQPGNLRVVAFDDEGNPAADKEIHTAGKAYKIVLEPDRNIIMADGKDLVYITASVVDKNEIPCPTANHELHFEVKGEGHFLAACNGDATSHQMFHMPQMKLFSGKLIIIVQSNHEAGDIEVKVSGANLISAKLNLTTATDNSGNLNQ